MFCLGPLINRGRCPYVLDLGLGGRVLAQAMHTHPLTQHAGVCWCRACVLHGMRKSCWRGMSCARRWVYAMS